MTEKDYCQFALDIQDASNLSGIMTAWIEILKQLPAFNVTRHPATCLILDKFSQLTEKCSEYGKSYAYCVNLTKEEEPQHDNR